MKNIGKIKAIIVSSIICFVLVLGLVLSFVPFSLGSKDYESFAGALSKSTSIDGGMSVEYTIKSESTDKEINDSIEILTDIISEYGFSSVVAYKKGDNKIRVDLNQPVLVSERSSTEDFLASLASGKMEFKNKNDAKATLTPPEGEEVDPTLIIIEVDKHVEKISKINSRGASGIQIDFNKEGKNLYTRATGSPLYMFVDGKAWPSDNGGNEISANNDPSATSLYLMFNSSDVVESYYNVLRAGTMSIELDSKEVEVIYNNNKTATGFMVAGIVLTLVLALGLVVYSIIKQRGFVIAPIVSNLIGLSLILFLLQAMSWVAFGVVSLVAIMVLVVLTYILNAIIYNSIKAEYSIGKSLPTATEDAYKKNIWVTIDTLIILAIFGFILGVMGSGELMGAGTILVLGAIVLGLNTLLTNRLIQNCIYSINQNTEKFFGLPKREEE